MSFFGGMFWYDSFEKDIYLLEEDVGPEITDSCLLIKQFNSNLGGHQVRQVGFLRALRFPPTHQDHPNANIGANEHD